jgi:hypothetical protein
VRLLGITGALLGALGVVLALVWIFQRRLIYIPLGGTVPAAATALPGASDVVFETEDGLRLGGWLVPPGGTSRGITVLVFNGNAGSRADRVPLAAGLARRGLEVLLFDYRGYAGQAGSPSEQGLLQDARAARGFLERRRPPSGRIVYFGESLGAAVAVALAAERAPDALVLRSPFLSLVEVGRRHYPFLPVRSLLRDRFRSDERVPGIGCPLLVIAGDADRIVPFAQSRALYERSAAAIKEFVALDGADHNDPALAGGGEVLDRMIDFFERAGVTE